MKKLILSLLIGATFNAAKAQADKAAEAFNKSYAYEANKDYKNAIASLELLNLQNSYEVNLRLGWLLYLNGNYTKSVLHYKRAIELQPKSVEARMGLAYPVYAMGNMEELIKNYTEILEIDPMHYTVNTRMATIFWERKQYEQALSYVQKFLDLYPFDYTSNLIAAKIYVALGKIVEAKKCYNTCLLYSPSDADVLAALKKL
jgi:tetratricopeptide (TPR) repeat protein